MRRPAPATVPGSAMDFLEELAVEQADRDLRAEAAERARMERLRGLSSIRALLSLPTLVLLGVLIWAAGWYDLWVHPGWLAGTAVSWILSVWYLQAVWKPRSV